jgi:hypothetical protein
MKTEAKPADQASTKPKVCTANPSQHTATDVNYSRAAFARKKRHPETSACYSAMPKTPKKIAPRPSRSTRVAWQDSGSSSLEVWHPRQRKRSFERVYNGVLYIVGA